MAGCSNNIVIPKNTFGVATPLRYPGGKSSLTGLISKLILGSPQKITTYIEPFAGGAGAAISLLENNIVENIVINDYDIAVYSFWKSVVKNTTRFIKKIKDTEISIEEWKRQRHVYNKMSRQNALSVGFAFFYLNRTNRSGIVTGGVIGGISQAGDYRLDARFNKEALINKIEDLAKFKKHIFVSNLDGRRTFKKYANKKNCFIYLDPPYVEKSGKLYFNVFSQSEHIKLSSILIKNPQTNWMLTYDTNNLIKTLYAQMPLFNYDLNYSAQTKKKASELLICSPVVQDLLSKTILQEKGT
ncbi:MAG: DNA adenine methylase [Treponematales bacterium]